MNIREYLESVESIYDVSAAMVSSTTAGKSYHSHLESGLRVHPVRDSMMYATYLLTEGSTDNVQRACSILRAVLALQDRDPTSATFGIWPYTAEEPLNEMNPPDWNWADLIGAAIALILKDFPDNLDADVHTDLCLALKNAAYEIFRRNIGPGYTNIAIMGAGVCVMAGELLHDSFLFQYGKKRLADIEKSVTFHGDFNEYNSPTYTFVAIEELARMLYVVSDAEVRESARRLYERAWIIIADHYHAGTGQIAGPHSRAYSDRLTANTTAAIRRCTGLDIPFVDPGESETGRKSSVLQPETFPWEPCPPEIAIRFCDPSKLDCMTTQTFIRFPSEHIGGSTWLSETCCLGSVSLDSSWTQRHGLIGYWKKDSAVCSCFKPQVLKNGREFASFMLRCRQSENAVIAGYSPLTNCGDWHLYLDHPADHVFTIEDLRFRFSVSGPCPGAGQIDDSSFALQSDGHTVMIYSGPGRFLGKTPHWEIASDGPFSWVDAVVYEGKEVPVSFEDLRQTYLSFALELVDDAPLSSRPEFTEKDTVCAVSWSELGLNLDIPTVSEMYPMDLNTWKQR